MDCKSSQNKMKNLAWKEKTRNIMYTVFTDVVETSIMHIPKCFCESLPLH